MPEGHTLHRIARRQRDVFGGRRIAASSPQGRFTDGAAVLDGTTLEGVAVHGKHLFHAFDGVELYVHLGLVGSFRTWTEGTAPTPTGGTRLVIAADGDAAHLVGPMACRLLDPGERAEILAPLGPDPIQSRWGRSEFARRLARKRVPIATALLDQSVLAGIGNVYRAELLFLAGISPHRPANRLSATEVDRVWDLAVDELRTGLRLGRIVTVRPSEMGTRGRSDLDRDEALYVYKRDGLPCRRCGTEIRIGEVAQRSIWWCPTCQPR
jgi:endonuclease-8